MKKKPAVKTRKTRVTKKPNSLWELRLYVADTTPRSVLAQGNLQSLCEQYLRGQYRLTIIDLVKEPGMARQDEILATPTLVRVLPEPQETFIGNLSVTRRGLRALEAEGEAEKLAALFSRSIVKWFGTCTDIDDLKRAQEELHFSNEKLEQRVQERTAELVSLNKELESFAYAVAHDLRAPLRHIHGFSDLLLHDGASVLSADSRHWLECVISGTGRMERLLEDLLNLSRLGRQPINRRTVALKKLVQEVIDDLAPETAKRLIQWKLGHLPLADCDLALMRVVFTNLLSNAVKFTRPRDVAVIEIGQQMLNGEPMLFVRDNGAGFDMKYVGKLFGVFQRLHLEKDFEGTGVGLATVYRILQKHGGRIWAESELDKGATFYFTLGGAEAIKEQVVAVEGAI